MLLWFPGFPRHGAPCRDTIQRWETRQSASYLAGTRQSQPCSDCRAAIWQLALLAQSNARLRASAWYEPFSHRASLASQRLLPAQAPRNAGAESGLRSRATCGLQRLRMPPPQGNAFGSLWTWRKHPPKILEAAADWIFSPGRDENKKYLKPPPSYVHVGTYFSSMEVFWDSHLV